ncbi:MAG: hypothetical protein OSJ63_00470 [Bacilli bacterium]|nr:hypothetical protein [Bacilli bacterium]
MKKTIGIIAAIGILFVTISTVKAFSSSNTTVIEYGKYITNVYQATDYSTYTITRAKSMNKSAISVRNILYEQGKKGWVVEDEKTVYVNALNKDFKLTYDTGNDVTQRRSLWEVTTLGGRMEGTFTLGDDRN